MEIYHPPQPRYQEFREDIEVQIQAQRPNKFEAQESGTQEIYENNDNDKKKSRSKKRLEILKNTYNSTLMNEDMFPVKFGKGEPTD